MFHTFSVNPNLLLIYLYLENLIFSITYNNIVICKNTKKAISYSLIYSNINTFLIFVSRKRKIIYYKIQRTYDLGSCNLIYIWGVFFFVKHSKVILNSWNCLSRFGYPKETIWRHFLLQVFVSSLQHWTGIVSFSVCS